MYLSVQHLTVVADSYPAILDVSTSFIALLHGARSILVNMTSLRVLAAYNPGADNIFLVIPVEV